MLHLASISLIIKKNVGTKKLRKILQYKQAAGKILVQLTPVVNFTKILIAAYPPILWRQNIMNPNVKYKKLHVKHLYEKSSHNMFVKLTPGR